MSISCYLYIVRLQFPVRWGVPGISITIVQVNRDVLICRVADLQICRYADLLICRFTDLHILVARYNYMYFSIHYTKFLTCNNYE